MTRKLAGPYTKLDRAIQHIEMLRSEIEDFKNRNPYEVFIAHNLSTNMIGTHVRVKELVPAHWEAIIGDAIHNMRTSFDLTINAVVDEKNFGSAFASIYAKADPRFSSGIPPVKGLSDRHFDKLVQLQPFNSGNSDLRLIHDLDIKDKHQMLLVAASASAYINSTGTAGGGHFRLGGAGIPTSQLGEHQFGMQIAASASPKFHEDGNVEIDIIFADRGPLFRQEVLSTLERLVDAAGVFVSEFIPPTY